MSHVHSGFRHELVWMPRTKLAGHFRAITWAAIAALILAGVGL